MTLCFPTVALTLAVAAFPASAQPFIEIEVTGSVEADPATR